MATGDQSDLRSRLRSLLPQGWFPEAGSTTGTASSPTPILDTVLSGIANTLSWAYSLINYAHAQTRIGTSTDGWLDIAALDYFGEGQFPRAAGETDSAYSARILANLLPYADTRDAVTKGVEAVGNPAPRIVEPWQPSDTGVWDGVVTTTQTFDTAAWDQPGVTWDQGNLTVGAFYWDVDIQGTPFRWTGSERFTAFIDTVIPTEPVLGGAQVSFYNANFYWDTAGSALMDIPGLLPGEQAILNAIAAKKAEGIRVFMRFAAPAIQKSVQSVSAWDANFFWNGTSYWSGTLAFNTPIPSQLVPLYAGPPSAFDGGYFYWDTGDAFWSGAGETGFILDQSVLDGTDPL